MQTHVVNLLVLDGLIPHFHFLHHPNIRCFSRDDEHHELNHKREMKQIHIHGPLPATDIAAPISRGLHTDWIVPNTYTE
jgi:hypothetical protein